MANKTRDKFGNPEGTGTQGAEYTFRFTGFVEKPVKPSGSSPASLKLADGRTFVPPELLPEPLRFLLREMDRILGRERAELLFNKEIENKVISQAFEDGTALSCKAAIIEFRAGLIPAGLWGKYQELCKAIEETWERWPVMRPPLIGGAYGGDSFSVSPSTVTRMPELRYGKYFGVELSSQMSQMLKLLQAREEAMRAQMEMEVGLDLGFSSAPDPRQALAAPRTPRASGRPPLLPINSKRPKFRAKIDPCTPSASAPRK